MRSPPRRPDAGLFDGQVLLRGLVQGIGLFGIVVLAYLQARSVSHSDETARALAFSVLVVSNLALIHVNRTWARRSGFTRPWNPAFAWIAAGTCLLLAVVLLVPLVSGLFAFTMPSPTLMLTGAGLCLGSLLWFQAVRWLGSSRER